MEIYSTFFSYIPFWHQKYIKTYLKPNLILGSVFFSRYRLSNGQLIFNFEILQNFA